MAETAIEFKAVNKWFGKLQVLREINLLVSTGEVVVVCGPSGSGKSTPLTCASGPDGVQQLLFGHEPARLQKQVVQHGKDLGCKADRLQIAPETLVGGVEAERRRAAASPTAPSLRKRYRSLTAS
jgi:ABC-type phosphate/phosphonate transport system ATPase subunit